MFCCRTVTHLLLRFLISLLQLSREAQQSAMAPRGRSRRVGLTRMDAAIDALIPLGFSKNLIRRKVNALLKVYDGDSGWVFIEEASYKLLIETILEEQEKELEKDNLSKEGDRDLDIPESTVASNEVVEAEPICTEADTTEQVNKTADNGELYWKDISCLDHASKQKSSDVPIPSACENIYGSLISGHSDTNRLGESDIELIHFQVPVDGLSWCRRKPCYGWIDNDDEEEDLVFLATEMSLTPRTVGCRKERKSRWDVKPEDM